MKQLFFVSTLFYSSMFASARDPFSLPAGEHFYCCSGRGEIGSSRCALIAIDGECYCMFKGQICAGHLLIEFFSESVLLRDELGREHQIPFQKKGPST